ncbi:PDIL1-3 [Symbiodinium sp. CCMP2592]|nr:PDIL1-3 [Symbiodinium sp. CCMP2592]
MVQKGRVVGASAGKHDGAGMWSGGFSGAAMGGLVAGAIAGRLGALVGAAIGGAAGASAGAREGRAANTPEEAATRGAVSGGMVGAFCGFQVDSIVKQIALEEKHKEWLEGRSSESTSIGDGPVLFGLQQLGCFPGTTNQAVFRQHKRGIAANRPLKRRPDFYSGAGVKNSLDQENWRLDPTTSYQKHFGVPAPALEDASVLTRKCSAIFKAGQQPRVQRYAHASDAAQQREFASVVRSLESLRTGQRTQSRSHLDFDRQEHERLWKPPLQRPVMDTAQIQRSQVALGIVPQRKETPEPVPVVEVARVAEVEVPQSPSVSHLGSLPLTAISYPESEVPSLPSTRSRSSKTSRPKSASGQLQSLGSQNSSKASVKAKTPSRPNSALPPRFTGSAAQPAVGSEKENHPEPSKPSGPEVGPQDAKLAKRFENVFRPIRTRVQRVMPAWDLAAQKLEIHDPPVKLAKIDASRYADVGEENEIHSYPTMKLFVDGAVFDYDGAGRGWQQIVKWVNRHLERDHVLKSVEEAETYLHDNDLTVIGLFPDGYDSSVFVKATRHYEDVVFAEARGNDIAAQIGEHLGRHAALLCETITVGQSASATKEVELPRTDLHCQDAPRNPQRPEWTDTFSVSVEGQKLTVKRTDQAAGWGQRVQIKCCDDEKKAEKEHPKFTTPSVVMFFPHDERYAVYDGDLSDAHALDRWVSARRTPTVMRMDQETAEKLFSANPENVPALILITSSSDSKEEKIFREAAVKLRGKVHCCLSGLDTAMERRTAEMAGVEGAGPVLTLVETHSGTGPTGQYHAARKFRLSLEGLSVDKVVGFVTDYEGNRLEPWLKSEPEPSAEDIRIGGPVGVLVGTNFRKTVEDESKDIMVDFYAPWPWSRMPRNQQLYREACHM